MANLLHFPAAAQTTPSSVSDEIARTQAIDVRTSCIVEAPAGSGKTGLLVQRFLKLLGDANVDAPEEVLAITFTNKATAELRERVLEQLRQAHLGPLPSDAGLFERETRAFAIAALDRSDRCGWALLERPTRLNIRSIDSVCSEIANSLPLLAGGSGRRQPVQDAMPLYRMAARRTLLQLGGDDIMLHNSIRSVLLHRDGSLSDCENLLADMLQAREQWGELVPLSQAEIDDAYLDTVVREKLERSLEHIVCAGLSRVLRAIPRNTLDELASLAARLSVHPPYKAEQSPLSICAGRNEPPEAVAEHLELWKALIGLLLKKDGLWRRRCSRADVGFEIPKANQKELEDLIEGMQSDTVLEALCSVRELPPAKYPDDQWKVAKSLFIVLRHGLAELRLLFAERGECDFAEIALVARAALRAEEGTSDIALTAGGKLRHLLIDEMQDTSSGQYELIDLLTRSWDGSTNTLFLVGDPKQSIYLFREARVERFLRTMHEQRLGEITLAPLHLTSNFRSQAKLVGDFNDSFSLLFPRPDDPRTRNNEGVDVPFIAANSTRPETRKDGVIWHPAVLSKEDYAQAHAVSEARAIREVIEQQLARPLPKERSHPSHLRPWRIAVLGRARSHLAAIIAEFKSDRGTGPIAFRGIYLDPLSDLIEILDAVALTRALLHPADRVAWLAVLRAPWCGLCKSDLLALTSDGDAQTSSLTVHSRVRQRRHHLSRDGQRLLDRVWPILELAVATIGRTSIATHVERTWGSLGGDVALSEEQRRNVQQYFSLLREIESEGRLDLSMLASRLKQLYAQTRPVVSERGVLPVDIMTIHKAKGLEWDVVLVPGLERGGGHSSSPLLNWLEFDGVSKAEEQASVVLAPIWRKGDEADQLSCWLAGVRKRREQAERKRVFYVAATRAREELHLFGAASMTAKGELSPGHWNSLLNACWPAALPAFQRANAPSPPHAARILTFSDDLQEADEQPMSLAASADAFEAQPMSQETLKRLPRDFNPVARFEAFAAKRLRYADASRLKISPTFERPEGSFAVRAFGNVVHRYLEWIASRLNGTQTCDELLAEIPSLRARLTASLRAEGLSPPLAAKASVRAEKALQNTLTDPVGRWILGSHVAAASERSLVLSSSTTLRVDRTFIAGDRPLVEGDNCIWIIDFKTNEQGSENSSIFESRELSLYRDQLEAYAQARRNLPDGSRPIYLGLYYPLLPRFLHWQSLKELPGLS